MFSQNILPTIFCWSVECRFYNITYLLIFCVRFAFIRTNQIFCSWSERRWETLIIEVKPSHLIFGNFRTGPALGLELGSERNFPLIQWTSCDLSSLLFRGKVTHSHTSYLSRKPREFSCKFFLDGVNFYRFNAKNWQFTVYFDVITQKIGNFLCILS